MKNLKSTKSRVIMSLAVLIVLTGLIPTLGIFSGGKHPAHASTSWQLQELWHTNIDTPSGNYPYPGVSDITYYSGKVFQTYGYNSLYYGGRFGQTIGFDANTGSKVWQKTAGYPDYPGKKPILSHDKIYLADSQYWLHVFDATNDQLPELWSGLSSTATLYNDTLLSHSGYGWVGLPATYYSYDTNTDSVNWQKSDTPCDLWPKIEVYNDIVYYIGCDINPSLYQPDYHTIVARKLSDGSLVWSQTVDSAYEQSNILYPISPVPSFNSTLISNGSIFLNASDPTDAVIASYSTEDGSQKWKKPLQNIDLPTGSSISVGQIIASGSTVYVLVSVYHNANAPYDVTTEYLYALDGSTGNEIWHNSTNLTNVPTNSVTGQLNGTLVDGVIYANYSSAIYAWDAATGNQLLMDNSIATSPDNPSVSTPLVVGDIMYNTRLDINSDTYSLYAYNITGQQPSPTPSPSATPSPTSNSCPGSSQKLFVFVQGVTSTLSDTQAQNGEIPDAFGQQGGIYPFLQKMCPKPKFLVYSYKGSNKDGSPQSYTCGYTFKDQISDYVKRLRKQIISYLSNSNTPHNLDVYLIGHSLGGVLSFALLANMELSGFIHINGSKIAGVITLDSPLGGVPGLGGIYLSEAIGTYKNMCPDMVKHKNWNFNVLNDLASIFTYIPNQAYGATASLMYPFNNDPSAPANWQIAETAQSSQQITILTIGNSSDYVYDFQDCPGGLPFPYSQFLSTQWVTDEPPNAVYGRFFTGGSSTCPGLKNMPVNHGVVLTDPAVQTGIGQFLAGQIPLALQPAPDE